MAECKDCIHFCVCSPYTAPNESYPEVDGCKCFRATADVVPKSEVEELIRENESLAKTVNEASELIRKLRSKVKKSKTEVAREIFEEIEYAMGSNYSADSDSDYPMPHYYEDLREDIAELKKKYI